MKKVYQDGGTFVFDAGANIENELLISSIDSAANDMYFKRPKEDVSLLPHDAGTPHSTNPLMVKNGGAWTMTSGSVEFTYTWTEQDNFDPDHLRNFVHYLETIIPEEENVLEYSIGPSGYITQHGQANGSVTEFSPVRPEYSIRADLGVTLKKGSSFICVIRTDPNADEWFTTYRDAQAGDTITLEPVGTKTYFIFGSVVQKDGRSLEKHTAYKVTQEIEVTCPEFTKIIRVHQK